MFIKFRARFSVYLAVAVIASLPCLGQQGSNFDSSSQIEFQSAPDQQPTQNQSPSDKSSQNSQDTATPAQPSGQAASPPSQKNAKPTTPAGVDIQEVPASKRQPKRILGMMPNYRAVSAGAIPPPPTAKQAFKIATLNSFDYSSFVFVGITSGLAFWTEAHRDLGEDGVPALWGYCWRGFVDKASGNYMVIFALPTILHEDERYYAMGEGNFYKRGIYAASRILITPDYHAHNTFNAAEVLGRAVSQGVSLSYYPKGDRTAGALAAKFGWAMGRDALTNVVREYWPDIATHVLHRHP